MHLWLDLYIKSQRSVDHVWYEFILPGDMLAYFYGDVVCTNMAVTVISGDCVESNE